MGNLISGILHFGSGSPLDALGHLGDGYFDNTGVILYGPKTVAGWGTGTHLGSGSGVNYVSLGTSQPTVSINGGSLTGTDKFDFSSYSSLFTSRPQVLRCRIIMDVAIAASTDNCEIQVSDLEIVGSYTPFSWAYGTALSSSSGTSTSLTTTADLIADDFDGSSTFNIWLYENIVGAGVSWVDIEITILGYFT